MLGISDPSINRAINQSSHQSSAESLTVHQESGQTAHQISAQASPALNEHFQKKRQALDHGMRDLSLWLSDQVRAGVAQLATGGLETLREISSQMMNVGCAKGVASRLEALSQLIEAEAPLGRREESSLQTAHPTSSWGASQSSNLGGLRRGWGGELLNPFELMRSDEGLSDATETPLTWGERSSLMLGALYLLVKSYERIDAMPWGARVDLLTTIGLSEPPKLVRQKPPMSGYWTTLGQSYESYKGLRTRRLWLWDHSTEELCVVIDHAFGADKWTEVPALGQGFYGAIQRFEGLDPHRVLLHDLEETPHGLGVHEHQHHLSLEGRATSSFQDAFDEVARTLAMCPWRERHPLIIAQVTFHLSGDPHQLIAVDREGQSLPLRVTKRERWAILSSVGDTPSVLFMEWRGGEGCLLSVLTHTDESACSSFYRRPH